MKGRWILGDPRSAQYVVVCVTHWAIYCVLRIRGPAARRCGDGGDGAPEIRLLPGRVGPRHPRTAPSGWLLCSPLQRTRSHQGGHHPGRRGGLSGRYFRGAGGLERKMAPSKSTEGHLSLDAARVPRTLLLRGWVNKVRSVRRRLFVALLRVPRPPAPRLISPSKAPA